MSSYFDINAQEDSNASTHPQPSKRARAPKNAPAQSAAVAQPVPKPAPVKPQVAPTATASSPAPATAQASAKASAPARSRMMYFDPNAAEDKSPVPVPPTSAPSKPSAAAPAFTPASRPSAGAAPFVPSAAPEPIPPQAYSPPAVIAGEADPRGWFPLFYEGEGAPFMFKNMHTGEQYANPSYHASFHPPAHSHAHTHAHTHAHGHSRSQPSSHGYGHNQPSPSNDIDDDDMARMEAYFHEMQLASEGADAAAASRAHIPTGPDCPCCLDDPYRCRNAECARASACYCVLDTVLPPADDDAAAMDDWVPASARCACCKGYVARCARKGEECKLVTEATGRTLCQCTKGAAFIVKT